MYYIIASLVVLAIVGIIVSYKKGIEKGIEKGRMEVLEEDLIRMGKSESDTLKMKVNTVLKQFENTKNHSRQAMKYVEPKAEQLAA